MDGWGARWGGLPPIALRSTAWGKMMKRKPYVMTRAGTLRPDPALVGARLLSWILMLLLAGALLLGIIPAEGSSAQAVSGNSLGGVHWYSGDSSMLDARIPWGQRGWNLEAIYDVEHCDGDRNTAIGNDVRALARQARDHGLVNFIRIDYRNFLAVPRNAWERPEWIRRFNLCVSELSDLSSLFIVGNEPNLEGGITSQQYADAFNALYQQKPAGINLLVAGPSGFSPVTWLGEVLNRTSQIDGITIHTYGNPSDYDIYGNRCDDPRRPCKRDRNWPFDGGFLYFIDQINQIPTRFYSKPVYITEINNDVNGRDRDPNPADNYPAKWINKAFQAVRDYNATRGAKPRIEAMLWFVDRDDGGWADFSLRNMHTARGDMTCEFHNSANRGGTHNPCLSDSPPPTATAPPPNTPPGSLTAGRVLNEQGQPESAPSGTTRTTTALQPGQIRQAEHYWGMRGIDYAGARWDGCSANRSSRYILGWHQDDLAEYLVNFPSSSAKYRITAIGLPDDPKPVQVEVYIDGQRVGQITWDDDDPRCNESESGSSAQIEISGYQGIHAVAFKFVNDYYLPPYRDEMSRDFFFDYFKFELASAPAPAPTPTPRPAPTTAPPATPPDKALHIKNLTTGAWPNLWITQCVGDGTQRVWQVSSNPEFAIYKGIEPQKDCGARGSFGLYPLVFRDSTLASGTWVTWCTGSNHDQWVWKSNGTWKYVPFQWPEKNNRCP